MRDLDDEDGYDYYPNELVRLEQENPEKYRRIVYQNTGLSVEKWERENIERVQKYLDRQRYERGN